MTPRQVRYFQLMERAVEIGEHFPDPADVDLDDPAVLAQVEQLLAEFSAITEAMAVIELAMGAFPVSPSFLH